MYFVCLSKTENKECSKLGCVVCNMYYTLPCAIRTQSHIALDPACNAHFISTTTTARRHNGDVATILILGLRYPQIL